MKNTNIFSIMDQEEYIWAMRTSANEKLVYHGLESNTTILPSGSNSSLIDLKNVTNEVSTLASFVPDVVLTNFNNYTTKNFEVCILCGDVSGFTDMCEKYNEVGSGGPSRLTDALNEFIGPMVQEIMAHGGDIIKFSGDAFLATWTLNDSTFMRDLINNVINCALVIQKSRNNFLTDVGIYMKVKLAITAGTLWFSLIGDENISHYIEVGLPIMDAKEILDFTQPGDILLSKTAWLYVETSSFLFEDIFGTSFIKVLGVGPSWRQGQKLINKKIKLIGEQMGFENEDNVSTSDSSDISRKREFSVLSEFALRPVVNEALKYIGIFDELKKFIIPPLMKRIELNEPLEGLSELRQISVIMINIIPQLGSNESLILLIKRIYKILTVNVLKYNGCINKVSCFDKDLMCVIVFGLRGLKQDLDCQNALKCAGSMFEEIDVLSKVRNVSVGVATGKTYCGVLGHTLRREYTVIGLTVNKAARLMVAYPNKVTCCHETFINSNLRERYFKLQQFVNLKGIKNPGPIYEFKYEIYQIMGAPVPSLYPILGRKKEMSIFVNSLGSFLEAHRKLLSGQKYDVNYQMIFVEGEAKVGKTRLIEEFIYNTPSDILINMIVLHNQFEPFFAMKSIFAPAMGMSKNSTIVEKKDLIKKYFKEIDKEKNMLCSLNVVFGVNFPTSSSYENQSHENKAKITGQTLIKLAKKVFTAPWIIIIERMTKMDEQTWQYLPFLLYVKTLFFICVCRNDKRFLENYKWVYLDKKVKHISLKRMENIYLGALACQMLRVDAIHPDLEYALQSRSNGCSGWISNFLMSLQHLKAIYIETATYEEIHRKGLITPPLYMMRRLDSKQLEVWTELMEEKTKKSPTIKNEITDQWSNYIDICRDSFTNIQIRTALDKCFQQTKVIQFDLLRLKACFLRPAFLLFNSLNESTEESKIVRMFDSLVYMEQLVAKCGSVLGRQFPRKILEYVMPSSTIREKAEAVRKLFELRIFGCSKGDFTEAGEYVLVRDQSVNDNENAPIECHCLGLDISECCLDLPKYASCGFLHFISYKVMEATYNLLPETQKVEFHTRAIRYLEKNTRKCRSCGNGFFVEFTGKNSRLIKFHRHKSKMSTHSPYEETLSHSHSISPDSFSQITQSANCSQSINLSDSYPDQQYSEHQMTIGCITPEKMKRLKDSVSLTRTFSMYDFSKCECNSILNSMYEQYIRHYKAIGAHQELLEAKLKYAKTCIICDNVTEAYIVLSETFNHLQVNGIGRNEPSWKHDMYTGKTKVLFSFIYLKYQQEDEALKLLYEAMEIYKSPFPKKNKKAAIQRCVLKIRQKLTLYFFSNSLGSSALRYSEIQYLNDKAECLSIFTDVFWAKNLYHKAELSATWALQCALKADKDFQLIIKCFSDMIKIAQLNHNTFYCIALEIHALRYCHKKIGNFEREDLKYVSELYKRISYSRMARSELEKTIYIGYICLRMSISVNYLILFFEIAPTLVIVLILKLYLQEASSLINELDYYSSINEVQSGKIIYYSVSLIFLIETGYTIIPYEDCSNYHYFEDIDSITTRNPEAYKMFVTLMWLWNLRMERWEYGQIWKSTIEKFLEQENKSYPISHNFVSLYLLEGILLCMVHAKNSQNYLMTKKFKIMAQQAIKNATRAGKYCKVLLPRLQRFKAYLKHIQCKDNEALALIEDSLIKAAKYEHSIEVYHSKHSKEAWTKKLSAQNKKMWCRRALTENMVPFSQVDPESVKIMTFTLPTPIYE